MSNGLDVSRRKVLVGAATVTAAVGLSGWIV
jgi:hypothetical protein